MRILLSGGEKTQNIVNAIAKKFEASNDQLLVEKFLDDINTIYQKGDFYDKAIITEQSITNDYAISDEYEIRNRINMFAIDCERRLAKQSFVFLTQDENMANIISEEILPISKSSVVVLAAPPYSVGFFHTIIINDVNQLPTNIVFKPKEIVSEIDTTSDTEGFDDFGDFDTDNGVTYGEADTSNLFGFDSFDNGGKVSDELQINGGIAPEGFETETEGFETETEGFETETEGFETETEGFEDMAEGFENLGGFEDTEGFGTDNNGSFGETEGFGQEFDNELFGDGQSDNGGVEQTFDDIKPIEQSSELPNYFEEAPVQTEQPQNNGGFDMGMGMAAGAMVGAIPGFDDDDYGNNGNNGGMDQFQGVTPPDNSFDANMYEDYNSQGGNAEYQNPLNAAGVGMSDSLQGFDFDDYQEGNKEEQAPEQPVQMNESATPGFSADDYNQSNMNPAMMAAGAMAMTGMAMQGMQPDPMAQQQAPQKKKGMFDKLKKNPQQTPQQTPQQQMAPQMQQMPQQQAPQQAPLKGGIGKMNPGTVKQQLEPFAKRGNNIVVTGCGGCGTSTIAFNLANLIAQLGYQALIVDMDTEHKTQSYISKGSYEAVEVESAPLMSAINSSSGIAGYTSVVRPGLHLLTMGMAADAAPVSEAIHKEKISRFVNLAKSSYDFVVYDVPFDDATGFLSEMTYMADNLVLVVDASNWGISKAMLSLCNISVDEMQDCFFNRAQVVFNKYRRMNKLFGKKVKTFTDAMKLMDEKVFDLTGEDIGLYFNNMSIAGCINDAPEIEDGWYSDVQYTDTANGQNAFLHVLSNIILNKQ